MLAHIKTGFLLLTPQYNWCIYVPYIMKFRALFSLVWRLIDRLLWVNKKHDRNERRPIPICLIWLTTSCSTDFNKTITNTSSIEFATHLQVRIQLTLIEKPPKNFNSQFEVAALLLFRRCSRFFFRASVNCRRIFRQNGRRHFSLLFSFSPGGRWRARGRGEREKKQAYVYVVIVVVLQSASKRQTVAAKPLLLQLKHARFPLPFHRLSKFAVSSFSFLVTPPHSVSKCFYIWWRFVRWFWRHFF